MSCLEGPGQLSLGLRDVRLCKKHGSQAVVNQEVEANSFVASTGISVTTPTSGLVLAW